MLCTYVARGGLTPALCGLALRHGEHRPVARFWNREETRFNGSGICSVPYAVEQQTDSPRAALRQQHQNEQ